MQTPPHAIESNLKRVEPAAQQIALRRFPCLDRRNDLHREEIANRKLGLLKYQAMKTLPLLCSFFLIAFLETIQAGKATWNPDPVSGDWSTATKWTPETVPNDRADVATFDESNTTAVTLSAPTQIDSIVFNPNASSFTVSTGAPVPAASFPLSRSETLLYQSGVSLRRLITQGRC